MRSILLHERAFKLSKAKVREGLSRLNGFDGIFPGHTILGLLHENQRKMAQNGIKPEEFEDRIIFMSMHVDIDWSSGEENSRKCVSNSTFRLTHTDSRRNIGLSSDQERKKSCTERKLTSQKVSGTIRNDAWPQKTNIHVLRATGALDRRFLTSKKDSLQR